jgi:uncharacterized SAM-binding protein YcdF (DUF218 family)
VLPELASFKPLLTALVMPPAVGLLAIAVGWLGYRRFQKLGGLLIASGLVFTWLVSCNGFAVWLAQTSLPPVAHIAPDKMAATLAQARVQAIIVLGGGAEMASREYGAPQPRDHTIARMHYAVVLAKASGLPLGFSGGVGRAAHTADDTEAAAVQRWLSQLGLPPMRWSEDKSRDTRENAQLTAQMLAKDGIQRIALVTNAWHMPRAQRNFESVGLTVLPAPMLYIEARYSPLIEWLPTTDGLRQSRYVFSELLGNALGH